MIPIKIPGTLVWKMLQNILRHKKDLTEEEYEKVVKVVMNYNKNLKINSLSEKELFFKLEQIKIKKGGSYESE